MTACHHKYNGTHASALENAGRGISAVAGALLIYHGLRRRNRSGASLAFMGFGLIGGALAKYHRRRPAGIHLASSSVTGIRVDEAITINRPRHEVYAFWKNPENLAEFMENVESVRATGEEGRQTHWVAKGPDGRRMEWDARVVDETDNEWIAWHSLEGSEVPHAGSIHFSDAPAGRGTEVRIALRYQPPRGAVEAFMTRHFGEEPATRIHSDLMRLKTRLEAGVVPTVEGQPIGAQKAGEDRARDKQSEQIVTASEASFPASDAPAYTH